MLYYVHAKGNFLKTEGIHLIADNWNDWYKYKTMYWFQYINSQGEVYDIGSVKIGQYNMSEEQMRPNIPERFKSLDNNFFSVGQSDEYYENLKKLDEHIRIEILINLRDMAYDQNIFNDCINEDVTRNSLMRNINSKTIAQQFYRIAHGGARLTEYAFSYYFPTIFNLGDKIIDLDNSPTLTFDVKPESNPPTNIHIVIGRNGVGKTNLIKNIISTISEEKSAQEVGYFFDTKTKEKIHAYNNFVNVICVGFSAFDDLPTSFEKKDNGNLVSYIFIGLDNSIGNSKNLNEKDSAKSRIDKLATQFANSLAMVFSNKSKLKLWQSAMEVLNYDNFFQESKIVEISYNINKEEFQNNAKKKFLLLSSGHKIILLTITRLVEYVEEKSLIILDEPETHLHPPLLAAFIRALSNILIEKNGVALVATHSPIVLQEVPASCVWKLQRSGLNVAIEKLKQETFGTNINSLTREIFGVEVERSGFNQLLRDNLQKMNYDFNDVVDSFNNELGDEARAILRILVALQKEKNL